MMEAKRVVGTIIVLAHFDIDGEKILETNCEDYDRFCYIPDVVNFEGRIYCKTGWNSDTGRACYKHGRNYAVKHH